MIVSGGLCPLSYLESCRLGGMTFAEVDDIHLPPFVDVACDVRADLAASLFAIPLSSGDRCVATPVTVFRASESHL